MEFHENTIGQNEIRFVEQIGLEPKKIHVMKGESFFFSFFFLQILCGISLF